MLDIETMGTSSNSAIVSIGAVEFNLETGEIGRTFYRNVDLQSCLDLGLHVEGSTVSWWLKQTQEARESLDKHMKYSLPVALLNLSDFIDKNNYYVWGNSARFDCGIIADAYKAIQVNLPWRFFNERDVRTLVSFAPEIKKDYEFVGVAHDALADCIHQIGYCSKIYSTLKF